MTSQSTKSTNKKRYTTIETDIENGKIKSTDISKLPTTAHVLITFLDPSDNVVAQKPDWQIIKSQIGKLKLRENTVEWQRSIRSEWE